MIMKFLIIHASKKIDIEKTQKRDLTETYKKVVLLGGSDPSPLRSVKLTM